MMDQHQAEDAARRRGGRAVAPRRASCAAPTRPEATSGGVGTAELTPMIATCPEHAHERESRAVAGVRGALARQDAM